MGPALTHDSEFLSAVYTALPDRHRVRWLDFEKEDDHWASMLKFLDKAYDQANQELALLLVYKEDTKKDVKEEKIYKEDTLGADCEEIMAEKMGIEKLKTVENNVTKLKYEILGLNETTKYMVTKDLFFRLFFYV